MANILIVDGQGGGLGRALVKKIKETLPSSIITAVGTNSAATLAMLQVGADKGATGENAVIWNAKQATVIAGGIGIIAANSMMGEISPAMAEAVSSSPAHKFLVPLNHCHIKIAGSTQFTLPELIDLTANNIKDYLEHELF